MKKTLRTLLIVAVALFLVWFAVRRYFNSRQVVENVVAHLEKAYGGSVKLDEVDIGLTRSDLNRIEFAEVDCATGADRKTPWLSIQSFSTDVSVFDLLKQEAVPTQVKLTGVKLFLRFSKDGKLLTCLPEQLSLDQLESVKGKTLQFGAFPTIELVDSQVTFHTEGSPDLIFKKLAAKLEKKKEQLLLAGSMENPEWGQWTFTGRFEQDSHELAVRFGRVNAATIHITPAMMRQLPFMPASVWEGPDSVEFRVVFDLNQGKLIVTR